VQLEDQFITDWLGEPLIATVLEPVLFANPVNKEHGEVWTPISNWNNHYTFYYLDYEEMTPVWEVTVDNQFGIGQELYVSGPLFLAVPTQKIPHGPPVDLDHFLVYEVLDYVGQPLEVPVFLQDQFIDGLTDVYEPELFANPVQKTHGSEVTDIKNPDDHLVFYGIDGIYYWDAYDLPIANQFGPQFLDVYEGEGNFLGVPSQKIGFSIAD